MLSVTMAGLNAAQKTMDVTSNNMANANTVGFKRSFANFGDVFSSDPAADPKTSVGSGVLTSSVARDTIAGSLTTTGRVTDMAIDGRGFFVVQDPTGGSTSFTRAGNFSLSKDGYLIDNGGNVLMGFPSKDSGSVDSFGNPVMVPNTGSMTKVSVTTQYNAGDTLPDGSIGGQEIQTLSFSGPATSGGQMQIAGSINGKAITPIAFSVSKGNSTEEITKAAFNALKVDSSGNTTLFGNPAKVTLVGSGNTSRIQIAFASIDGAIAPLSISATPNPGPSYLSSDFVPAVGNTWKLDSTSVTLPSPPSAGTFTAVVADGQGNLINVPIKLTTDATNTTYTNSSIAQQIKDFVLNPTNNVASIWQNRTFSVDANNNLLVQFPVSEGQSTLSVAFDDPSALFGGATQTVSTSALSLPSPLVAAPANLSVKVSDGLGNDLTIPVNFNSGIADQIAAYIKGVQSGTNTVSSSVMTAWLARNASADNGNLKITTRKGDTAKISITPTNANDWNSAYSNTIETISDANFTNNLTVADASTANVNLFIDGNTTPVSVPVTFTRTGNGLSYASIAKQINDYFVSTPNTKYSTSYDTASGKLTFTRKDGQAVTTNIQWQYAAASGASLPQGIPSAAKSKQDLQSVGILPTFMVSDPTINPSVAQTIPFTSAHGKSETLTFADATSDAVLTFRGKTLYVKAGDTKQVIAQKLISLFPNSGSNPITSSFTPNGDGVVLTYDPLLGNVATTAPSWSTSPATAGSTGELAKGSSDPVLMQSISVASNGQVMATFSNGSSYSMGFIALANFSNDSGLKDIGGNRFAQTGASGVASISPAGAPKAGNIMSGQLEQSNVDITNELMTMIRAQQVYNGNARVLQTMVDTISKITDMR